jgi:PAS domain S-box-containing protein
MRLLDRFHPMIPRAIPAFFIAVGIGLSYFAFQGAQRADQERVQNTLEQRVIWRTRDLQDKIADATVPVEGLATFIATQKHFEPEEFHSFAKVARGDDPIERLFWSPLVPADKRAEFETVARREDAQPDFSISELNANGRLVAAGMRDEYLPIRFDERFGDVPARLGFDRLSLPVSRAVAERARDSGDPILTPLLKQPGEQGDAAHTVLDWPVYRGGLVPPTVDKRREALLGFASGSYRIDDLFAFALRNSPAETDTLSLFVSPQSDRPLGRPAARFDLRSGKIELGRVPLADLPADAVRISKSFSEFGQTWTLVFDYPSDVVAGFRSPLPWGYFGLGVLLTLALSAFVASQQRRQSQIQALVAERTGQLSRTAEQLKAVFNASPLAIGSVDTDNRMVTWNRAAENIFGYEAAEILGDAAAHPSDAPHSLIPEEEWPALREHDARLRSGEILSDIEVKRRSKDGRLIPCSLSASAMFGADGSYQGRVFTLQDITERKRAEAAEKEHFAQMLTFIEQAPMLVAMFDRAMNCIAASSLWRAEYGHIDGQFSSFDEYERLSAASDEWKAVNRRAMAGETIETAENRQSRADGSVRWLRSVVQPWTDADQKIGGIIIVDDDITEQKLAVDARLEHHVQQRTFIEQAPMMIAMFDRDMNYLAASGLWITVYGGNRSDLIGLNHYEVVPNMPESWKSIHLRGLAGEVIRNDADQWVRPDGSIQFLRWVVQPWIDSDSNIGGIIIAVDDYSDRKEAEDIQRETTERLQAIVDTAADGIVLINSQGSALLFNPSAEQLFGYRADEVLGRNIKMLMPPPFADEHDGYLDNYRQTGKRKILGVGREVVGRRKDGSTFPMHLAVGEAKQYGQPIFVGVVRDLTAQHKADEALQRSREHLARVQNVARIGSTEVDLITGEAIWSDEIYRLLGIDSNSIEPGVDSFAEAVHPDDRAALREVSLKGRNGQQAAPLEFRVVRSDGQIRWFYRTADFIRDGSGRPLRVIATMYEITERKRAEDALRRSQEHLARVQTVARIGSIEIDLTTQETTWSDEMYRLLGIEPQPTAPGVGVFTSAVHPDDRAILQRLSAQARRGEDSEPCEFRVNHSEGTVLWLYCHSVIIRDGGRPVRHIATMYDITERKRAEMALRESERRFAVIFRDSPVAIWISDLSNSGRIIDANGSWLRTFGLERNEVIGRTGDELNLWPDSGTRDAMYAATLKSDSVWSGEVVLRRKDGSLIDTAITIRHTEIDGQPRAIGVGIDITERKVAEAHRVQLEKQLQQAQKMEAIGQLTGGVAHDFNNLLMVMLGNLELIQEQIGETHKVSPWITDALSAGKSGSDLTYRLLAFSRRQTLEPESTDINRRIAGFVPLIRRTIGEAIEIKQKLADSVWPVMIDPNQFDSAILNLSVNARDAMPGGGWIEIATENVTVDEAYAAQHIDLAAGDYVRVAIADSGVGMSPDVVARAFEPFFTTKEVGKGTGLGLSMVYGFIKQSGGNVTIYSEVGKGTVIRLLLPRATDAAQTDVSAAQAQGTAAAGDATILVVEDDAKVRAVTVAFLATLGYRTLDAGTGHEALTILAAHPEVALLLSDVILAGGETGPEVAEAARRLRPDLKIMFASGYTEDALERNGHLDPDVALLRKPFTKSALSTKVKEALDRPPDGKAK